MKVEVESSQALPPCCCFNSRAKIMCTRDSKAACKDTEGQAGTGRDMQPLALDNAQEMKRTVKLRATTPHG